TFVCALVPGPGPAGAVDYARCGLDSATYLNLADATQYTFSVIAVDALGNRGAAASQSFTVDGLAPAIHITSPASGQTGTVVTLVYTPAATTGDSFQCAITTDMSTEVVPNCTSGQVFSDLGPGPHTVTVSGTDACGNAGADSVDFAVVVPTTVTIESPAA